MATRKKSNPLTDPLAPTPYNPRLEFTPAQLEAFQKSLKEFGDLSVICFNVRTGHLVGGNKRAAEFRERGKLEIVEQFKEPDSTGTVAWGWLEVDGTRFVYRQVDWTEEKEKLANIAANQHGAEFDNIKVAEMFAGLPEGTDFSITGFDSLEIDKFLKPIEPPEDFKNLGEDIATNSTCPKCGYQWSKPK